MRRIALSYVILPLILLFTISGSFGQATKSATATLPFVSPIFGDNMVLQRGKPNTIWGWSTAGDTVRVEVADQSASGVAGADGRWQVKIQPPVTGGPYVVHIQGKQSVELHEVMVGDVWLCGGQSNMQVGLMAARNGAEDAKTADHPEIRFFTVQSHSSYSHADVPGGSWKILSPQTAGGFGGISAVAYYFALKVQDSIHIPIGLVIDALGGTPAEAWTSAETIHKLGDFDAGLAEIDRLRASGAPEYGNYIMHYYDQYDIGEKGKWWDAQLDDSDWKTVRISGAFRELGLNETPAVVWFRKEITLPDPLPAGRARIFLGSIEKMDTTYINGQSVGASSWVENPRAYFVKDGVLKPGRNEITVRVFKLKSSDGFLNPEMMKIEVGDGTSIPLSGAWKAQVSVDARPPHPLPMAFENWPVMPSVLYRGMLEPIAPLAITGALWYQGEQNSERAYQYRKVLPAMIADWRKLFGQGEFPFYIVSLPGFGHRKDTPVDDDWAELREAQAMTARSTKHSCLAVAIDVGDPDNLHPRDKKEVGDRLAFCALAEHYGKKFPYAGPTFKSAQHLPGALKLTFEHTDGGLVAKGSTLGEFSVAGEDHKWYWADAKIEGDAVIVSSKFVPDPKEARYAWQGYPEATLFNGAELPAVPFRTDDWPGKTVSVK